jgi:hypothetical protein
MKSAKFMARGLVTERIFSLVFGFLLKKKVSKRTIGPYFGYQCNGCTFCPKKCPIFCHHRYIHKKKLEICHKMSFLDRNVPFSVIIDAFTKKKLEICPKRCFLDPFKAGG